MAPPDPVTWSVVSLVAGAVTTSAYLTWFISGQFSRNRSLFYKALSLHNREDDDRFEALSCDIWTIQVRNARKDGDEPLERKTLPRRRYLDDEIEANGD